MLVKIKNKGKNILPNFETDFINNTGLSYKFPLGAGNWNIIVKADRLYGSGSLYIAVKEANTESTIYEANISSEDETTVSFSTSQQQQVLFIIKSSDSSTMWKIEYIAFTQLTKYSQPLVNSISFEY